MGCTFKIVVVKPKRKRSLENAKSRLEDIIKMGIIK
jgi:hypothetical protein